MSGRRKTENSSSTRWTKTSSATHSDRRGVLSMFRGRSPTEDHLRTCADDGTSCIPSGLKNQKESYQPNPQQSRIRSPITDGGISGHCANKAHTLPSNASNFETLALRHTPVADQTSPHEQKYYAKFPNLEQSPHEAHHHGHKLGSLP